MKLSGTSSAGTSYLDFEDVKVPVEYLLGEEGQAFAYILQNFNHVCFISFPVGYVLLKNTNLAGTDDDSIQCKQNGSLLYRRCILVRCPPSKSLCQC